MGAGVQIRKNVYLRLVWKEVYYIFQVVAFLQAVVEAKCDEDKFHKDKEVQHYDAPSPYGRGLG